MSCSDITAAQISAMPAELRGYYIDCKAGEGMTAFIEAQAAANAPKIAAENFRLSIEGAAMAREQRAKDDAAFAVGAVAIIIALALTVMMFRARRPRFLFWLAYEIAGGLQTSFASLTASHRALLLFGAIGLTSISTLGVAAVLLFQL